MIGWYVGCCAVIVLGVARLVVLKRRAARKRIVDRIRSYTVPDAARPADLTTGPQSE